MKSRLLVVQLLLWSLAWPAQEAYAYLDPGTGSLLLQSLFAIVAIVGAGISLFWERVRGLFHRRSASDLTSEQNNDAREKS